ncbi:hypothetical protein VTO42DRAFT_2034 [Malbranchea cinnamomea]
MAAVCAAFASRQLARSAGIARLPIIARRTFISSPLLRAKVQDTTDSSVRDTLASLNPTASEQQSFRSRGGLGAGSIFVDDFEESPLITTKGPTPRRQKDAGDTTVDVTSSPPLEQRDREILDRALDPYPNRRARWLRKMVIRSVRKRGRLTKREEILQTEREHLCRSHWFKTSLKKLGPLARQIAGKNIDDAILQMRFSKKKAAKDVKDFLEQAKNEAVVVKGMGLGKVQGREFEPITVTLKNRKRITITDPTSIYIAQAWVNRGPYGRDFDHRARGQINVLRPPHTGLSVLLKEEKTRIREWREREEKEARRRKAKVWVQLPDRKVTAQNQYYSW